MPLSNIIYFPPTNGNGRPAIIRSSSDKKWSVEQITAEDINGQVLFEAWVPRQIYDKFLQMLLASDKDDSQR